MGVGFLVAPADSVAYWLEGTFAAADRISPVASTANHSLAGLLARAGAPEWIGLAATAVVGAAGLAVAVLAHRRGETLLGVTVCGLLSAAVAPFAWSHHFVWFGPLVVLLAHRASGGDRRAAVALAGVVAVTAGVRDPPARAGGRPDPEHRADLAAARRLPDSGGRGRRGGGMGSPRPAATG